MTGVEIMNDDPYLTEVLYAKIIDQDEILQRKCYSPAFSEFSENSMSSISYLRIEEDFDNFFFYKPVDISLSHEIVSVLVNYSYYKSLIDSFLLLFFVYDILQGFKRYQKDKFLRCKIQTKW